jgi:hypothetical protein
MGAEHGVNWDVTATPEGDRWGCRLEIYGTDEPDMDKWQTELAFRLAGGPRPAQATVLA